MFEVTINNDKNGIEVRFESKPESNVLAALKEQGFRWSQAQKMWYAKQSAERMDFIKTFDDYSIKNVTTKYSKYNLWDMTRTDNIENNFEKYKIIDTTEIAKIIRKHVRERFPMCKWSVTSDHHSICVSLKCSPWEKDSDEIATIVHYVYSFAQSYNYNNSDPYSDYFDVNFYGVYESQIVDYNYEQRPITDDERVISDMFRDAKGAWEKSEEERKERELEIQMAEEEARKIERERLNRIRNENHRIIEDNADVREVEYFVLNCETTNTRKEDNIEDYTERHNDEEIICHRENNGVVREVRFDKATYELFTHQLMDDYSFLEGMGGTATSDRRIKDMVDFSVMSEEERATVEWYNVNCVAIFCDGVLKLVIDPQGYNYARYVYFVDDKSVVCQDYNGDYGISSEELARNESHAKMLEDASKSIINKHGWYDTFDRENFNAFKAEIKEWISENKTKINPDIIRAVDPIKIKEVLYSVLSEINSIGEQFNRADFTEGQKITIIKMSDFGGMSVMHGKFVRYNIGDYAQYSNAVKIIYRPKGKRSDYYMWLHGDVIIYNGYIDIPETLLWDIVETENSNIVTKKSKFLSCDMIQYKVILDYFKDKGIMPIVNTYK